MAISHSGWPSRGPAAHISFICFIYIMYSDGSLSEPSSPDEPAAILSADFPLDLLHFIHGFRCVIPTVEKIGVVIATGIPKIC